jgi:hypothetical protein
MTCAWGVRMGFCLLAAGPHRPSPGWVFNFEINLTVCRGFYPRGDERGGLHGPALPKNQYPGVSFVHPRAELIMDSGCLRGEEEFPCAESSQNYMNGRDTFC